MRVVVAGSSGFLGHHLVEALRGRGHEVVRLVRHAAQAPDEREWDPAEARLDPDHLADADVVVTLSGTPTAGNPHSATWRRELRDSRVASTGLLARTIADLDGGARPALLAGNGISYYGDHGDELLDESADSRGSALLTEVTRDWQAATHPAEEAGARVVVLRTSPVLDRESMPLKALAPLARFGLATRLGDGRQYFPMISLRDWVGAVCHLAETDTVAGPVNLCCRTVPTNAEFTDALARHFGRRALLVAPAPLIKVGAGAMAPEVLGSVRAVPAALQASGYEFLDPGVEEVIESGLARAR